jgi:imidazolonepropionase-like amidohydrolase
MAVPWRQLPVVAVAALAACTSQDQEGRSAVQTADLAIVNATVLTMASEQPLESTTVLVEGDRITWIGPASALNVPETLRQVDGTGRFLIPGLIDSHAHTHNEDQLQLFVANGVTTVRDMFGKPHHLDWMDRLRDDPDFLAPTLRVASPILDGDPPILGDAVGVSDPDAAAALVADYAESGFQAIKVYSRLSRPVYDAVVAAADEVGLPVEGHVPQAVGLDHAIESGMRAIEHFTGYEVLALSDSVAASLGGGEGQYLRERARLATEWQDGLLTFDQIFDPTKMSALARRTAAAGVWNVPTLTVNQIVTPDEYESRLEDPGVEYVDRERVENWRPPATRNPVRARSLRALIHEFGLRLIAAMHSEGAMVLVGTDTANPFVVPGFSIHNELANFVAAGLSPSETLRSATRLPAEFLGLGEEIGSVSVGRRADLVLLDANPLADITNLKRVVGVILRGRWLDRADIDSMLDGVADRVNSGL